MKTVFSYVVAHDYGLAPNPYYGFCTLSCCKPVIRRKAEIGDLVIGMTGRNRSPTPKLLYMMQVTEILDFDQYWADERFSCKKPDLHSSTKSRVGDNIYRKDNGSWIQADSKHSNLDGTTHEEHLYRDTHDSTNVLISRDFVYYGKNATKIDDSFSKLLNRSRGNRVFRGADDIKLAEQLFKSLPRGMRGFPTMRP